MKVGGCLMPLRTGMLAALTEMSHFLHEFQPEKNPIEGNFSYVQLINWIVCFDSVIFYLVSYCEYFISSLSQSGKSNKKCFPLAEILRSLI